MDYTKDYFQDKAADWDEGNSRVQSAKKIAEMICKKINLNDSMEIMDFGVGTGLLGFEVAKKVRQVHGVDTSASMIEKLHEKNTAKLNIKTYCQDIIKNPLTKTFDGMVSSMTLHHIKDLKAFFETIYKNITDGGFIAIADLESEDGTFHSDNTGVFHFGFNETKLCNIIKYAGFKDVEFKKINTINKPNKDFGIFLLTATK